MTWTWMTVFEYSSLLLDFYSLASDEDDPKTRAWIARMETTVRKGIADAYCL